MMRSDQPAVDKGDVSTLREGGGKGGPVLLMHSDLGYHYVTGIITTAKVVN